MASPTLAARPRRGRRGRQHGGLLIEALIAIMIFSIGILGMVGLQATAVQQSSEARYRSEAAQLVDLLVGEMWAGDRSVATLQAQYNNCTTSACAGYAAWFAKVQGKLPGVAITGATAPTVNVDPEGLVTVSVFWRPTSENPSSTPHRYDSTAQIR
jgi:type IV pilus assembly protein PilV